jgi:hypothetical protein
MSRPAQAEAGRGVPRRQDRPIPQRLRPASTQPAPDPTGEGPPPYAAGARSHGGGAPPACRRGPIPPGIRGRRMPARPDPTGEAPAATSVGSGDGRRIGAR